MADWELGYILNALSMERALYNDRSSFIVRTVGRTGPSRYELWAV